jgi:putative redox protein
MVRVREKSTVTQRIRGRCPTHSRTEIAVRDVTTVIDEAKEREGTNIGPTPTETMVAALIACTPSAARSSFGWHRSPVETKSPD